MKTKMTHAMRRELADAIRDRYAVAANKDKRRILDEFVAATGYHEKSAIRVLNTPPGPRRRQTRQRASLYDEAALGALIVLWEASDRVCGKRLKALLPILLPALERNGHLKLEMEIRCKILSIERCDDRSPAPDAEAQNTHQEAAKDCARAAPADQNAYLCRLE
jgi:hypothetical protein